MLELRHLIVPVERWHDDLFDRGGIPSIEDAWRWNPDELLLRDYYANALMPFAEVKKRGWPERRVVLSEAKDLPGGIGEDPSPSARLRMTRE
ncbi:MAG TPA: hypothetical protein VHL59_02645 [Thermoanaerobaculia bacterium]|nr:hypothetical protein [Thermoanaerobaculia bacterium]